jgi:hypothetical protein
MAYVAKLFANHGIEVVCCAVPDAESRGTWDAKARLEREGFAVELLPAAGEMPDWYLEIVRRESAIVDRVAQPAEETNSE